MNNVDYENKTDVDHNNSQQNKMLPIKTVLLDHTIVRDRIKSFW